MFDFKEFITQHKEASAHVQETVAKYNKDFREDGPADDEEWTIDHENGLVCFEWQTHWGGESDTHYCEIPFDFFIDYDKAAKARREAEAEKARKKAAQERAEKARRRTAKKKAEKAQYERLKKIYG